MPPRTNNKNKQGSSNNSNKPSKGTLTQLNKKRKASEVEDTPNKQNKANQSAFKILSSKMKGGKQTCSKHLQEKCADTSCSNPHYTIVNVIEENQFKDSIKKYNGCNDAMSKTLGDENQEAVIMEIIMRKVRKDELEKLIISPKDHLYYSMGIQGASTQQLNVIRNLRNKIQGCENRTKMFHSNEDNSQDELVSNLKIITANHIFKCSLESNTKATIWKLKINLQRKTCQKLLIRSSASKLNKLMPQLKKPFKDQWTKRDANVGGTTQGAQPNLATANIDNESS
ncbi:hypothetical protein ABPG72_005911 [Tetrahymena utriculariae]